MNSERARKRIGLLVLMALVLSVFSTASLAQQPEGGQLESVQCGDNITCYRSNAAVKVKNEGAGAAFFGKALAPGTGVKGQGKIGVWGFSFNGHGMWAESDNGVGLYANSYLYAVQAESEDQEGVYGVSTGAGIADNGILGRTNSTDTDEAGVKGENIGVGPGVIGQSYAAGEFAYGVRAYSDHAHGIYSDGGNDSGNYGGYFTGFGGLLVETSAVEPGYGLYVTTDDSNAVWATASNDDGLFGSADGSGFWGVWGMSDDSHGVYGDTNNGTYGFYTNDVIYAGGGYAGPKSMLIAQNGGGEVLQPGDLVAVAGIAAGPSEFYGEPILLVRKADSASAHGLVGVVEGRYVTELITKEDVLLEGRDVEIPDGEGGESDWQRVHDQVTVQQVVQDAKLLAEPAGPGETLLIVNSGITQVRVDASAGAIQMGDRLAIGMALESMAEGQGLIWVLVDMQ